MSRSCQSGKIGVVRQGDLDDVLQQDFSFFLLEALNGV